MSAPATAQSRPATATGQGPPPVEVTGEAIVPRPYFGRKGRAFKVKSNFFPMQNVPGKTIYHWEVKISTPQNHEVRDRASCRQCIMAWAEQKDSPLYKQQFVYDGQHILYTPVALKKEGYDAAVEFPDDGTTGRDKRDLRVDLKFVAGIDMNKLIKAINNETMVVPMECVQVLNVVLGHHPSLSHFTVGRAFYPLNDPASERILANSQVMLNIGYRASVRPAKGRMLLNIDVANTLTYKPGPLMEIVLKAAGIPPNNKTATLSANQRQQVAKHIIGLKTFSKLQGNKRSHRIQHLSKDSVSVTSFATEDGKKHTVASWFKQAHNYTIQYPNMPCFNSNKDSSKATWIPLEVCEVDEKQLYRKTLDLNQSREMITITCQPPNVRAAKINESFSRIQSPAQMLEAWSLKIDPKMMDIDARCLDIPSVKYADSSKAPVVQPVDGAWNLRDKKMLTGMTLSAWTVVAFADQRTFPGDAVKNFVSQMVSTCKLSGLNITDGQPPLFWEPNATKDSASIGAAIRKAIEARGGKVQMVMCLLANANNAVVYNTVKLVTDTMIGVPSQCVQEKHVRTANAQYCANVCMKLNLKLGGANSMINGNLTWFSERPTMVIGADVTHPSQADRSMPSVAAVVGSIDKSCAFYRSSIRVQDSGEESLWQLGPQVEELLRAFIKRNGKGPERLLFYRDGVSEGEFDLTSKTEVNSVLASCEKIRAGWRPKITYVACQKRHNARFFPEDGENGGGGGSRPGTGRGGPPPRGGGRGGGRGGISYPYGNIPPGTVVDSTVTHPSLFDFFMCSHAGLKGTSRPTHYHVLRDDNRIGADELQALTYELCYTYGKATRSVSVVTPVYYAHVVAKRARCWFAAVRAGEVGGLSERLEKERSPRVPKLHPALDGSMWFM